MWAEQALLSVHSEQTSSHVSDGYARTVRSETSLRVSLPLDLNKVASLLECLFPKHFCLSLLFSKELYQNLVFSGRVLTSLCHRW